MLYRSNFISSIYEARRIIKTKKALLLGPAKKSQKFFSVYLKKKPYYQVPLFFAITLTSPYNLLRKIYLRNVIYAWRLISYPPAYLLTNYKTMISMRILNPKVSKVRYGFRGSLANFIGAALYF